MAERTIRKAKFLQTDRKDLWWLQPLIILIVLSSFVVYATWAAFQAKHYHYGNYLSPLYSPEIFGDSPHAWFGSKPGWWPTFLPWSPALLILWAPGLFRLTCYYYRGAYYKSFWSDPFACSVGEPRNSYRGEKKFPLIMQNVHRYMMYIALAFIILLSIDVWNGLWFENETGGETFGIGVGTLVLAVNVVLLGGYTLGCHSLRHIVGGFMDRMSGRPVRKFSYKCVSCLNRRHKSWAWMSLVWVAFTDVYIRLCSMGVWTDFRIL